MRSHDERDRTSVPSLLFCTEDPTTKLTSDKLSEMHVRVYGDTAVITLLDTADFIVEGKDAGGVFRLTDVWVKRDGKWQTNASSRLAGTTRRPLADLAGRIPFG